MNIFLNHILGTAAGGAFFGAVALLGRGRWMGLGDVKLAMASGLLLGWPDIALTIILAFIFGGAVGLILVLLRQKNLADKLPFAPFFAVGTAWTVFFGYQIINFYFRLFQIG